MLGVKKTIPPQPQAALLHLLSLPPLLLLLLLLGVKKTIL